MLIDEVFKNPKWKEQGSFPSSKEWRQEINKIFEFVKRKNELDRFLPRLNSKKTKRDEALDEIIAAYVLEKKLNYKIIEWEKPTISGKNVDLLILNGLEEIYCEVKSPGWEAELNHAEKTSDRKSKPKYNNAEARSVGSWENIQYAIIKAYEKFLPDKKNMVILCPDLFVSLFVFPDDLNIKISLYDDTSRYNSITKKDEKGCFSIDTYENVGGLLIIEKYLFCSDKEVTYKYKFFPNEYSKNPFNIKT